MSLEKMNTDYISPFLNPFTYDSATASNNADSFPLFSQEIPINTIPSNPPLFSFNQSVSAPLDMLNFSVQSPSLGFLNGQNFMSNPIMANELMNIMSINTFAQKMFENLSLQTQNIVSAMANLPQINFLDNSLKGNPYLNPDLTAPAGYGNNNFNVTKLYTGTAADLNKNLKGVLKGKGDLFIKLQQKYGINAAFLVALVNAESAHGSSDAAVNKHNVAGIMSRESNYNKLKDFSNCGGVDACLEELASNLSRNYVNKGLVTISQIHKKYCPIGAGNDPNGLNKNWGNTIQQMTTKYESQIC